MEVAPERDETVTAELERLGDHPWAGVYRTHGSWPTVLRLAPEAGYTLYENSWCGNCAGWRGVGKVVAANGLDLTLDVELGYDLPEPRERPDAWFSLEPTLHLVPWGDLLFAVPPWRMERFCAEVSDGWRFPGVPFRSAGNGAELDPKTVPRPSGTPQVPDGYRHLVVSLPITGRVEALAEWRLKRAATDDGPGLFEAEYTIDAGADRGVAVGMRFYLAEREYPNRSGRVERVEAGSCRVVFTAREDERVAIEALVGSPATTLHPMHGQEDG
jgi:hypothetical protein